MLDVLRSSWALYLGMTLLMIGNGLQGTLLGVRGALESFSPDLLGYIMAGYFIGFIGGSKLTPILLRRVGHVRVFAALGSLISAAFIMYAAIVEPITWFLMRVIVGFCFSGVYVVAESWINDASSNENRGAALGIYIIVQMFGVVFGQLLLNVADPGGYDLFVLLSVMVSLSFAPILLSVSPAPVYEAGKPMSLKELFQASPLGAFGSFMLGAVFSAQFGMGAVYATEAYRTAEGVDVAQVSFFLLSVYLGAMLTMYPIGFASDRMDRRILIIAITGAGALVCLAAPPIGGVQLFEALGLQVDGLIVMGFLIGGLTQPLYALLAAHTNDFLEKDQMASASSGLVFLNGAGAMGGPVIVGYVMGAFGSDAWWTFCFVFLAAISVYGLYRSTQRPTVAIDETGPHAAFGPRVTPVAAEMIQEAAIERMEALEAEAESEADERDADGAPKETTLGGEIQRP